MIPIIYPCGNLRCWDFRPTSWAIRLLIHTQPPFGGCLHFAYFSSDFIHYFECIGMYGSTSTPIRMPHPRWLSAVLQRDPSCSKSISGNISMNFVSMGVSSYPLGSGIIIPNGSLAVLSRFSGFFQRTLIVWKCFHTHWGK